MENEDYKIPEEVEEMAESLSGGYWNYRIVEKEDNFEGRDGKNYKDIYYVIHEVYYNGKDEIWGWTQEPMSLWFEDEDDIKATIKHIKKATKHTILKMVKDKDGDESLIDTGNYLKNIKR